MIGNCQLVINKIHCGQCIDTTSIQKRKLIYMHVYIAIMSRII